MKTLGKYCLPIAFLMALVVGTTSVATANTGSGLWSTQDAGVAGVKGWGNFKCEATGTGYERLVLDVNVKDTDADGHHVGVHLIWWKTGGTSYGYYFKNYDGAGTTETWNDFTRMVSGSIHAIVQEAVYEKDRVVRDGSYVTLC